jgi:hypothetical protein
MRIKECDQQAGRAHAIYIWLGGDGKSIILLRGAQTRNSTVNKRADRTAFEGFVIIHAESLVSSNGYTEIRQCHEDNGTNYVG